MPLIDRRQDVDEQAHARGYWREAKARAIAAMQPRRPLEPPCGGEHVGPHNRCEHATPPPEGYRRCEGDPGCEFRLAVASGRRLCRVHEREAAIRMETPMDRLAELMGATR